MPWSVAGGYVLAASRLCHRASCCQWHLTTSLCAGNSAAAAAAAAAASGRGRHLLDWGWGHHDNNRGHDDRGHRHDDSHGWFRGWGGHRNGDQHGNHDDGHRGGHDDGVSMTARVAADVAQECPGSGAGLAAAWSTMNPASPL